MSLLILTSRRKDKPQLRSDSTLDLADVPCDFSLHRPPYWKPPHDNPNIAQKMAYAERKAITNKHPWTLPKLAGMDDITRPIGRPPPGELNTKTAAKTMGSAELARRKNDYFEEVFSMRGDRNPLRERIRGDSTVLMELKTNVIVSLPGPYTPRASRQKETETRKY